MPDASARRLLPIGIPSPGAPVSKMMTTVAMDERLPTMQSQPVARRIHPPNPTENQPGDHGARRWLARPGSGDLDDEGFAAIPLTAADDKKARHFFGRRMKRDPSRSARRDEGSVITIGERSTVWYDLRAQTSRGRNL